MVKIYKIRILEKIGKILVKSRRSILVVILCFQSQRFAAQRMQSNKTNIKQSRATLLQVWQNGKKIKLSDELISV